MSHATISGARTFGKPDELRNLNATLRDLVPQRVRNPPRSLGLIHTKPKIEGEHVLFAEKSHSERAVIAL